MEIGHRHHVGAVVLHGFWIRSNCWDNTFAFMGLVQFVVLGRNPRPRTATRTTTQRRCFRFLSLITGLARRSSPGPLVRAVFACWGESPRSIVARCWFDSDILHHFIRGLRSKPLCPRQSLARSGARIGSPSFVGDWQRWLPTRTTLSTA
jgi:hypothetical protein